MTINLTFESFPVILVTLLRIVGLLIIVSLVIPVQWQELRRHNGPRSVKAILLGLSLSYVLTAVSNFVLTVLFLLGRLDSVTTVFSSVLSAFNNLFVAVILLVLYRKRWVEVVIKFVQKFITRL